MGVNIMMRMGCETAHLHAVRNPLLVTINDPVFAVLRLCCGRLEAKYVTSCMGIRDLNHNSKRCLKILSQEGVSYRKADELLSSQDFRHDFGFKLRRPKVQDRRKADHAARVQTISVPSCPTSSNFLINHKLHLFSRIVVVSKMR